MRNTIYFEPFRLDCSSDELWRGHSRIPLSSRAAAILSALVTRAGTLVSKDELLQAVWGEVAVHPTILKVYVREVRRALGDSARRPRYIETIGRHGYRFVANVLTEVPLEPSQVI